MVVVVVEVGVVGLMVVGVMILGLVSIGQQIFGTSLAKPQVETSRNFLFSLVIGFCQKSPRVWQSVISLQDPGLLSGVVQSLSTLLSELGKKKLATGRQTHIKLRTTSNFSNPSGDILRREHQSYHHNRVWTGSNLQL